MTPFSVISDKEQGIKTSINGKPFILKIALVDPELTYTCPPAVTAISGIDVICHALFDSIGSVNNNPISDGLAVTALKLAFNNLSLLITRAQTLKHVLIWRLRARLQVSASARLQRAVLTR